MSDETSAKGKSSVNPDLEENSGVEFPGDSLEPFLGTT